MHVPIPDYAQKKYDGKYYQIYEWKLKKYDGSIGVFERPVVNDSVVLVIGAESKILIIEEEQPHLWHFIGLPSGFIDSGETPEQAAKRELLEETGRQGKLLFQKSTPGRVTNYTSHLFFAQNCKKVAELNLDPGEKIIPYLVELDEFFELVKNDKLRWGWYIKAEVVECLYNKKKRREFETLLWGDSKTYTTHN